jgi:membrane associated rhomboid family serine protease
MQPEQPGLVAVARARRAKVAREYALVLAAVGIESELEAAADETVVAVDAHEAQRARTELELYERENRGWRRPEELPLAIADSWHGVAIWVLLLLATQALGGAHAFGRDWWARGVGHAGAVEHGEWWRAMTALGLHVDALHLLGNILFGCLFVALVAEMLGTGLGLFAVLGAGALANLTNSWINEPSFRSVGASTAVFAALGLLGGHRWQQRRLVRRMRKSSWIPLVAAAVLLGYLGSGASHIGAEARVDVSGHALGFAVGVIVGALLGRFALRTVADWRGQPALVVVALAMWIGAWWRALA